MSKGHPRPESFLDWQERLRGKKRAHRKHYDLNKVNFLGMTGREFRTYVRRWKLDNLPKELGGELKK